MKKTKLLATIFVMSCFLAIAGQSQACPNKDGGQQSGSMSSGQGMKETSTTGPELDMGSSRGNGPIEIRYIET
ncbi:MAG: hypothetical protein ACLGPL_09025 [Acidobacteriota bacterium]